MNRDDALVLSRQPSIADESAAWRDVERLDPQLLAAHKQLTDAAWCGGPLEPRLRALVLVAAEAVLGGIDPATLRTAVRNALDAGASVEEITDVVALVSILGIHTIVMASPILAEELETIGQHPEPVAPDRSAQVRADFERRRGYWSPLWDAVNMSCPEFLAAYLDYSSIPAERGTLSAKERELVLVVANSVTTHLNPDGMRVHLRNALALGATSAELMHVFQLLATIGFRTVTTALPLLANEASLQERHPTTPSASTSRC